MKIVTKTDKVENAPLKDCVIFFFSETKVKCVQKSYHSFGDNGWESHVIRFFNNKFVPRGRFTPPMG